MSQINVNDRTGSTAGDGGGTAAAGINFLAVVVVAVVAIAVLWFLFTGPLSSPRSGTAPGPNPPAQQERTDVNVNLPKVEVNPPAQQPAAPSKP